MKRLKRKELPVKCIKCENKIKTVSLEDDVEPKKGEYVNDVIDFESPGCVGESTAPGILVEMINPTIIPLASEYEATFHGYLCDGCLKELIDKKIIEEGPDEDKKIYLGCVFKN